MKHTQSSRLLLFISFSLLLANFVISMDSGVRSTRNTIFSSVKNNIDNSVQSSPSFSSLDFGKKAHADLRPDVFGFDLVSSAELRADNVKDVALKHNVNEPTLKLDNSDVIKIMPEPLRPKEKSENKVATDLVDRVIVSHPAQETKSQDKPRVTVVTENNIEPEKVKPFVKEPGVLYQSRSAVQDEATIAFNFEDASLANLVSYIESVHDIKFITDDIILAGKDVKGVAGHKITFRTNKNLTRKESWDLFLTFLHVAGLDVVPLVQDGFYKIVSLSKAAGEIIPTFIGLDVGLLPDNDMIVRFVYFTKNIDPAKIQPVLKTMQGGSSKCDVFGDLKALIFTDRASSIKSMMQVVTYLDKAVLPEVLTVVKLKRANVADVISLYKSLNPTTAVAGTLQKVWVPGNKKEASLDYFPRDVGLFGDNRTNSLILLGTAKEVQKVEDFIIKYVDVELDRGAPPVFTYRLQYTTATDIAKILNEIVRYGSNSEAGKYGGVRDGVKYFQPMTILADTHSNSLVINATEEDFKSVKPLIEELDVQQKQVGLEVLIVQVTDVDLKTLGSQISGPNGLGNVATNSNGVGPTFLSGVTAQTSGIPTGTPIVATAGTAGVTENFSLKSSLAYLLGQASLNQAGSVLVTFGRPIWAIFKVLKSITSTHVITNPFVVVSNNSTAKIVSGQQRQQVSSNVVSSGTLSTKGYVPIDAHLVVTITPQINKNNIINMNINISSTQFVQSLATDTGFSSTTTNAVQTVASVANGETLVIGGIMQESYASSSSGVPFLENIPLFGWFFKSKTRTISRAHFLIFIAPRLLENSGDLKGLDDYTDYKLREAQNNLDIVDKADGFTNDKDPIQKAFFGNKNGSTLQTLATGNSYSKRQQIERAIEQPSGYDKSHLMKKKRNKKDKKNKNNKMVDSIVSVTVEQSSAIPADRVANDFAGFGMQPEKRLENVS